MTHAIRRLLALCLLLLGVVASPAIAQDEEDLTAVALPDTPPGRQMAWALGVINGQPLGDASEHFSDHFIENYTLPRLQTLLNGMRERYWEGGLARVVDVRGSSDLSLGVVLVGEGSKRVMSVFLVLDDTNAKIAGFTISPAIGFEMTESDWDAMSGEMGRLTGGTTFGCYEIVPDPTAAAGTLRLRPVHEFSAERPVNIGAGTLALRLLRVLGELKSVGQLDWSQEISLREDRKSVPPGSLAQARAGATFRVGELALRMMRDADNTAMDHLIAHAGRLRVADVIARRPANTPFLTTRQYFTIKLSDDAKLIEQYAGAGPEGRQEILDAEVTSMDPAIENAGNWTMPRAPDTIGFFASAYELCDDWRRLRQLETSEGQETLREAMRAARGLRLDPGVWPETCFRGGAEPGVQCITVMMRRADGRWFTIAAGWNDAQKPLEQARLVELIKSGIRILEAYEPSPEKAPEAPPEPKPEKGP